MNQGRDLQEPVKQPRGARRRARTRTDLLVAARKVFAIRGYHDATITEITETAAVGAGTFYLHFPDKEAIFTTVLEEGLQAIRQQVMEEVAYHSHPSLPVAIRAVFHRVYEQRDLIRIARMGAAGAARRSRGPDLLVEMFLRFLEGTQDLAPFSQEETPLLAVLLEGLMDRAFHWWDEQDEPDPDAMTDHVLHLMQYGFPACLFEEQHRPVFPRSQRPEEKN
jgi:AcrR family transcriptional regulator